MRRMTALQWRADQGEPAKRRKYGNTPTVVDGVKFASAKEAAKIGELRLRERAGEICGLQLQPKYPLTVNGVKVCDYVADAAFMERNDDGYFGKRVVVDIKSEATRKNRAYRIKAKLFRAIYGFGITEL